MRLRTVGLKLSLALDRARRGGPGDRLYRGRPGAGEPARRRPTRAAPAGLGRDRRRPLAGGRDSGLAWDTVVTESQRRGLRITIYEVLQRDGADLPQPRRRVPAGWDSLGQIRSHTGPWRPAGRATASSREAGRSSPRLPCPSEERTSCSCSAPIDDTLEIVSFVRKRLLAAGLIALLAAALVGFFLARVFARRVHRLERAANRIAGGRFDEPVVDTSADELGELARAFDRMREQLATLERARREFIANASHELRTPIFALGGHVELLTDEDMDEPTRREFLSRDAASGRASHEARDRPPRPLPSGCGPFARGNGPGRPRRDRRFPGRGVRRRRPRAGAPARGGRPRQARSRSPTRSASARSGGSSSRTRFSIRRPGRRSASAPRTRTTGSSFGSRTPGPGIPPDDQQHVFERFYRAGGAVTSGSGLGLAIARELAGVMGGEIVLDSRPGRTVFTLKLPRSHVPVEEPEHALAR